MLRELIYSSVTVLDTFSLVSRLVAFPFTCPKRFAFIGLGYVRFVHVCLYLHGYRDGAKMSKRKKNYPDPMEIVNKYGADALR